MFSHGHTGHHGDNAMTLRFLTGYAFALALSLPVWGCVAFIVWGA